MGYSLCMIADFQNALISPIIVVSSSGFLNITSLNDMQNGF